MKEIYHEEAERINKLFFGRKIVEAKGNRLTLDNGTELFILPNDGGCICGAGDYFLDNITKFDNVITNAEVKVIELDKWEEDKVYQLFVYSGGISTSVADIKGSDGNGYYGTGFSIMVKEVPEVKKDNRDLNPVEEY